MRLPIQVITIYKSRKIHVPVHVVRLKSAYHKYIGHFIIKWMKFPYNKPRLLVSLMYLSASQVSRAESLMNEDIPQSDQDIVKTE